MSHRPSPLVERGGGQHRYIVHSRRHGPSAIAARMSEAAASTDTSCHLRRHGPSVIAARMSEAAGSTHTSCHLRQHELLVIAARMSKAASSTDTSCTLDGMGRRSSPLAQARRRLAQIHRAT